MVPSKHSYCPWHIHYSLLTIPQYNASHFIDVKVISFERFIRVQNLNILLTMQ